MINKKFDPRTIFLSTLFLTISLIIMNNIIQTLFCFIAILIHIILVGVKVKNLIKTFGSDLGVLPEDYYAFVENEEPLYKYDKETDEYIYNEEAPGTDAITDLDSGYIYNYILDKKESKEDLIILTYYGLYAYQDEIGPTTITNQKNIERLLNYEETFDGISDQEYLQNAFKKNKEDFLKWSYTFKKVNDNYVLVDFKQA